MNVRTTIVLLVLVLAGVGYVLFNQFGWLGKGAPSTQPAKEEAFQRLTPDIGAVQKLTLEGAGAAKVVLSRQGEQWRLNEPIDAPAAFSSVSEVTTTVTGLSYLRKYAAGDADCPKDDLTHLSSPLRVVSFADDQGHTYVVKVGRTVPLTARQTYVQLAGSDAVYVVETDLAAQLNKSPDDFRLKEVVDFKPEQVQRVEVRGNENFQLVKVEGNWSLDKPVSARADAAKVSSLLSSLSSLSATKFVADAPGNLRGFGLADPRLLVTVEYAPAAPADKTATQTATTQAQKNKIVSLAFGGSSEGSVFAKLGDQPWVFQVDQAKLKDLQPKLAELRDKRVMDLSGKEIVKLEVSLAVGGGLLLEKLEKDQDKWQLRAPIAGPAEDDSVAELVNTLTDLKATAFEDNPKALGAYGLEPPQGKIVMHFRGSDKTATLLLGQSTESGQRGCVMPADAKSVSIIASGDFAKLLRPAAGYWNKTIFALPEDSTLTQVDLAGADAPPVTVRRDAPGQFKLVKPVEAQADGDNARAAFDALRTIKADKVIALGTALPERFAKVRPVRITLGYSLPAPSSAPASGPSSAPASAPATGVSTASATGAAATTRASTGPTTRPELTVQAGPILVIKEKDKSYVWLEGAKPLAVGELGADFYDKLTAEMRDRAVMKTDPAKTVSVKLELDTVAMELTRQGDTWRYAADKFVTVDAERIKKFLTDLGEIKAQRFADYSEKPELARFGLDKPILAIETKTEAGKLARLTISRTGPVGTDSFYAASTETPGVFVLASEASKKMRTSMEEMRKAQDAGKTAPKPPETP